MVSLDSYMARNPADYHFLIRLMEINLLDN